MQNNLFKMRSNQRTIFSLMYSISMYFCALISKPIWKNYEFQALEVDMRIKELLVMLKYYAYKFKHKTSLIK